MAEKFHLPDLEIQALLDGALDDGAARAARAHLATCAGCTRRMEAEARLFAEIESWEEATPPHDLAPRVLTGLRTPAVPVGLRWAAALQAGLVLLVVALGWPFIAGNAQHLRLPSILLPGAGTMEAWLEGASTWIPALKASLLLMPDSAAIWLRTVPNGIAIWPALAGVAVLVALVGNSILLWGAAGSPRAARPRRV